MLRSSSTPFPHHHFLSSSSPSSRRRSCLHLRRAFSDGHLPSLHPSSSSIPNDAGSSSPGGGGGGGQLHTELSFSIYNTFGGKGEVVVAAPLASSPSSSSQQEQEEEGGQQPPTAVVQPDHPEVPLFLARGLGIDRIASGFFTAGGAADKTAGCGANIMEGVAEQDEVVAALDAQYKTMVDEQPGNALFLRNYAQFLHEVIFISRERYHVPVICTDVIAAACLQVKGDTRRAEEYYSRAMLADPSDGEIMSQYAKLVWEVHHDPERCLGYFQKSVQAAPHDRLKPLTSQSGL